MRILHARDYVVQPWKNGGGMTTEVYVEPPGASFEAFDWRISMARVSAAGPFSMFAGIDRSLGLLEGDGMTLLIEGRGALDMKPGTHAAVFPGDVPVTAQLAGGPILDLNVMTRRARWRHHLSRVAAVGSFALQARGDVTIALVRGAGGSAGGQSIGDGDALMLEAPGAPVTLVCDGALELWIADLWRLG